MTRSFTSFVRVEILLTALLLTGCAFHGAASTPLAQPLTGGAGIGHISQNGNGEQWKAIVDPYANQTSLGEAAGSWHAQQPGFMWVTDRNNSSLDQLNLSTGKITAFTTSTTSQPIADTLGPDERIWFMEYKGTVLYAMATSSPFQISQYSVMLGGVTYFPTSGLTTGPDGNIWYAADNGTSNGYAAVMSTSGTMVAAYQLTPGCAGVRIASGPDGNLWLTTTCSIIERVTPTGTVTAFTVPNNNMGWYIMHGPDGNMYFTEVGSVQRLGKITLSTGVVSEIASPDFLYMGTGLITVGDQIWFVDELNSGYNAIGRFDVSTQKFLTPMEPPPPNNGTRSQFFAMGHDGNVYFTNTNGELGVRILLSMKLVPDKATIAPGGTQTVTVSETNYSGTWTAASNDKNVATVAPGGSSNTFVVTGHAAGTARIKISDAKGNSAVCVITAT